MITLLVRVLSPHHSQESLHTSPYVYDIIKDQKHVRQKHVVSVSYLGPTGHINSMSRPSEDSLVICCLNPLISLTWGMPGKI